MNVQDTLIEKPLSSTGTSSSAAGEQWIEVFQQREVWNLTEAIVDRWVTRNAVFFGMLARHVPSGSKTLELGCGPGRHALGAAMLGYRVVGIDVDPAIVQQAQANARSAPAGCEVAFKVGDMFNLDAVGSKGTFQAITHGGVMEHLESAESIRDALRAQLAFAPCVIFDIPFNSLKNRGLFDRDDIFRQLWTPDEWIHEVLADLPVGETAIDLHPEDNMTDDLVIALRA